MKTTEKQGAWKRLTAKAASVRSFARWKCLALAPLLSLFVSCSTTQSGQRTIALEANLAQDCPPLPFPPSPLIDPARAVWEAAVIAMYGDCASKHRSTVRAWPKAAV